MQEYLFVSAGIYSLLDTFEKEHGENWELLPQFVAIHTNDTHPAMCGPELMRILIDEKKLEWDDAWNIVTQVVSYTNHTILPEALGEVAYRHVLQAPPPRVPDHRRDQPVVGTSRSTPRRRAGRSVCARPPSCGTARFAWPTCL